MVSVTITYKQPGTQPPIFVAGSFSNPKWEPQEMDFTTEDGGEHTFYKNIEVRPNAQIEYKFRVGLGDWWVLNETAAIGMFAPRLRSATFSASSSNMEVIYSHRRIWQS